MIVPREKSVFNIHCEDLRFLYQLRVGLSPLKAHKFRHKFIDTPSDVCTCRSGSESTTHFLLCCPIFNAHRERLMELVQPIGELIPNFDDLDLSEILLYGSKELSQAQNHEILKATLTYIRETGRFSRESEV